MNTYRDPKYIKNVTELLETIKNIQTNINDIKFNFSCLQKEWYLRKEQGCLDTDTHEKVLASMFLTSLGELADLLFTGGCSFEEVVYNIPFDKLIEIDNKIKNKENNHNEIN